MPGLGTRYVFFPENDKKVCFAFAWSLVVLHHPIINNGLELYQKGSLFCAIIAVPSVPLNVTLNDATRKKPVK